MDYLSFLSLADKNPEKTPIHTLFNFCVWAKDDPSSFTITVNDVLRYLGSSFHYHMVVSNHPGIETQNPGLLFSHVLVPVSIAEKNKTGCVKYSDQDIETRFSSVILPKSTGLDHGCYAHHMGVLIAGLSATQAFMLKQHQSIIKEFSTIAGKTEIVDFRSIFPYKDHFSQVVERFNRNHIETETI